MKVVCIYAETCGATDCPHLQEHKEGELCELTACEVLKTEGVYCTGAGQDDAE